MGVDTKIYIDRQARLSDVGELLAIVAGCDKRLAPLQDASVYIVVDGLVIKGILEGQCADIDISKESGLVDGERSHSVLWHWEPDSQQRGASEHHLLMPRSTAFWIAVGRRLVDFFGGFIIYQDSNGKVNYRRKKPRKNNAPSSGKEWDRFQREMFAQKPITRKELADAAKHASYK